MMIAITIGVKVSRTTFEQHRTAILDAAARMFGARGLDRVGVAEVSRAAGLTHGALYGHFPSKDALIAATCRESLAAAAAVWRRRAARARAAGGCGLAVIIGSYLSESHRDEPGHGCMLGSLGQELARSDPAQRRALDEGAAALLAVIEEEIGILRPELAAGARAHAASGVLAAMTGGITLARCIADPVRSAATLRAAADAAHAVVGAAGQPS